MESKYDYISSFNQGVAIVSKDGLYGAIILGGKEIITPKYQFISQFVDGFADAILDGCKCKINLSGDICVRKGDGFVELPDFCLFGHDFKDGVSFVYTRDKYWTVINESGEKLCNEKFFSISDFSNGYAIGYSLGLGYSVINLKGEIVYHSSNKLDLDNNLIIESTAYGVLKRDLNGKIIVVDKDKRIEIPKEYSFATDFVDGCCIAKYQKTKDGNSEKWLILSNVLRRITEPKYDEIYRINRNSFIVKEGDIWSILNITDGSKVNIEGNYQSVSLLCDNFFVGISIKEEESSYNKKKNTLSSLIYSDGKIVLGPDKYTFTIDNERNGVLFNKEAKQKEVGYIDKNGIIIVSSIDDSISVVEAGFLTLKEHKYCLWSESGEKVIEGFGGRIKVIDKSFLQIRKDNKYSIYSTLTKELLFSSINDIYIFGDDYYLLTDDVNVFLCDKKFNKKGTFENLKKDGFPYVCSCNGVKGILKCDGNFASNSEINESDIDVKEKLADNRFYVSLKNLTFDINEKVTTKNSNCIGIFEKGLGLILSCDYKEIENISENTFIVYTENKIERYDNDYDCYTCDKVLLSGVFEYGSGFVIPSDKEKIQMIPQGYITYKNHFYDFVDKKGNKILKDFSSISCFDSDCLEVCKNAKKGIYSLNEEKMLIPLFDDLYYWGENFYMIKNDKKVYLYDKSLVLLEEYDNSYTYKYVNVVCKNGEIGLLKPDGKFVLFSKIGQSDLDTIKTLDESLIVVTFKECYMEPYNNIVDHINDKGLLKVGSGLILPCEFNDIEIINKDFCKICKETHTEYSYEDEDYVTHSFVEKNKLFGVCDLNGKIIIDPRYSKIEVVEKGFIVYNENLKEFRDINGKFIKIIEDKPEGALDDLVNREDYYFIDRLKQYESISNEIKDKILSKLNENNLSLIRWEYSEYNGKITKKGQIVVDAFVPSWYCSDDEYSDSECIYENDSVYYKGKFTVPDEYDWAFNSKTRKVIVVKNNYWGVIDTENNVIIEIKYDLLNQKENLYVVCEKGKYGIYNDEGCLLCNIQYDFIEILDDKVYRADNCLYNINGKLLISNLGTVKAIGHYLYFVENENGDKFFIDRLGESVLSQINNVSYFGDSRKTYYANLAVFESTDLKLGVINSNGEVVLKPNYGKVSIDSEGYIQTDKGFFNRLGESCIKAGDTFMYFPTTLYEDTKYIGLGLIKIKEDGLWGIVDIQGNRITDSIYTHISDVKHYLIIVDIKNKDNNLEGIIDISGKIIVPLTSGKIFRIEEHLILFLDNSHNRWFLYTNFWGVITNSEFVTDGNFSSFEYIEYLTPYLLKGYRERWDSNLHFDIIDYNGQEVTNGYYNEVFLKGDYVYCVKDNQTRCILTHDGRILFDSSDSIGDFCNGYAIMKNHRGNYGLIREDFSIILPCIYPYLEFSETDYLRTGHGYVNYKGQFMFSQENGLYKALPDIYLYAMPLADNLFKTVAKDNKKGIMSKGAEIILPPIFDDILLIGGLKTDKYFIFKLNELYGIVDCSGKIIIPATYSKIEDFVDNKIAKVERNIYGNTYGYIDTEFKEILPATNKIVYKPSDDKIIFCCNDNWGYYDMKNGNCKALGDFTSVESYKAGKAEVCIGGKAYLYDSKLRIDGGKWGVIDKDGGVVLPFIYDDVIIISSNRYGIRQGYSNWGVIDEKRTLLTPFKYNSFKYLEKDRIKCYYEYEDGIYYYSKYFDIISEDGIVLEEGYDNDESNSYNSYEKEDTSAYDDELEYILKNGGDWIDY